MIVNHAGPFAGEFAPEVDMTYTCELPVLGISTRFETNSRDVHRMVNEAFGAWALLPRDVAADTSWNPTVRVCVREGSEGVRGRSPVRHHLPDERRVIAVSANSVGISDPDRAEAVAHVTGELVADHDHFRDEMLQAITLALLSSHDRHFLHAAAVARGPRAVLLAAPSGTGKSTLACLAHRAGLQVMSEDRVWIQRSPSLRVWGWPVRLHLRPGAVRHFRELSAAPVREHSDGTTRHVVDVLGATNGVPRFHADEVVVCLLSRGEREPSLHRVGPDAIVDALTHDVAPGFDRHPDRHAPSMRAIAGDGGWRLRLSSDPHQALPLLEQMLGAGA